MSKLSESDLRRLNSSGLPIAEIAKLLSVTETELNKILIGVNVSQKDLLGRAIISWSDIDYARESLDSWKKP